MPAQADFSTLLLDGSDLRMYSVPQAALEAGVELETIPFVGRIFLEAVLRSGDVDGALTLARRLAAGLDADLELSFRPARVLVQDYTGIPLLVDLAAIREHVRAYGGLSSSVNPAVPTDVVVDHSIQVDFAGTVDAAARNEALEFERNTERYAFLKWAQQAFTNLRVIPPGRGIVHQVNLETLATVVAVREEAGQTVAFPDTVVGTDSHTTMVNGLGILGWGIGGLEAEAIMLGLAQPMPVPKIVGVRLSGRVRAGVSATDLVLALTARLRSENVTGVVIEFSGPGLDQLSAPDRCTIANMAPEYGAMAAFFPTDAETLRYLRQTGREEALLDLIVAYCNKQRLLRGPNDPEPSFGRTIEVDLGSVDASLAGPSNPHQRIGIDDLAASFLGICPAPRPATAAGGLADGDIVIAAITSCTNTSNPKAMLAAGLVARRAVRRGLRVPAHIKVSLAPGSHAVTRYLAAAGLDADLARLGFHHVGYGCTTCNGGSGPLHADVADAIERDDLTVCAVLSGNRNFDGRIHSQVRAGYLASPAMVVALALAGNVQVDLRNAPLGLDSDGQPVFLADLWPDDAEIAQLERQHVRPAVFATDDTTVSHWDAIVAQEGPVYEWRPDSTYIRRPPYLDGLRADRAALRGARALVVLGDFVSTDHISPVGSIAPESPAGIYLRERNVGRWAFNSYGARRGNHEVMMRGSFASPRLRNALLDGAEGGFTLHVPSGERLSVFAAAMRYASTATPLLILAGKGYGIGSSRDWAAKGPSLLGVRAVIAESFERIHRANLCAMGILPLTFPTGQSWQSIGLTGHEEYALESIGPLHASGQMRVRAQRPDGTERSFIASADVHSQGEWDVLLEGGLPAHMLRSFDR
jgi:aconitate hydratase